MGLVARIVCTGLCADVPSSDAVAHVPLCALTDSQAAIG